MDGRTAALDRLYENAYCKGYNQAMKDAGITEKEMEAKL